MVWLLVGNHGKMIRWYDDLNDDIERMAVLNLIAVVYNRVKQRSKRKICSQVYQGSQQEEHEAVCWDSNIIWLTVHRVMECVHTTM